MRTLTAASERIKYKYRANWNRLNERRYLAAGNSIKTLLLSFRRSAADVCFHKFSTDEIILIEIRCQSHCTSEFCRDQQQQTAHSVFVPLQFEGKQLQVQPNRNRYAEQRKNYGKS